MLNECLHLLGDGAFLKEDKELTYEEHKSGKTKSSCEAKKYSFTQRYDGGYDFKEVENKETKSDIDLLKEKYRSGNYICVFKNEDITAGNWYLLDFVKPSFLQTNEYKLIHKKHEYILKAYLDGEEISTPVGKYGIRRLDNFIEEYDETLQYDIYRTFKMKLSCERKFKVGDIVTGVNPTQLSIYQRVFKIIDYDEILKAYILENALGYKEEDLELYVEKSMAKKRFSVGNFIAVANSKLENYNKVLRIVEINGNDVKLSDGSVVFWTDIEMFQREETKSSCEDNPLKSQVGGGHYKDMKIQPVEYCMANNLNICESNVIKYVSRHRNKNGIEDLKKAKHFIDLLIELEYKNGND